VPDKKIRLPEAPPPHYLRWMGYWREVEALMLSNPALEKFAAEQSAPFIREPVADYLSDIVMPEIIKQASDAERRGQNSAAPVIEVDPDMLAKGLDYVRRRGEWLLTLGRDAVPQLDPELVELRSRVLEFLRPQLSNSE
jgi:hypothetical protein